MFYRLSISDIIASLGTQAPKIIVDRIKSMQKYSSFYLHKSTENHLHQPQNPV